MKNHGFKEFIRGQMDQTFPGESPLRIERFSREKFAEKIRQTLGHFSYLEMDKAIHDTRRGRPTSHVLDFTVDLPLMALDVSLFEHREFTFVLDQDDQLGLIYYDKRVKVSSLSEILTFGSICQSFAQEKHTKANQLQKIRDLKTESIVAQLKKLSREKGYVFGKLHSRLSEDMTLYVKLSGEDNFELKLHYKNFPGIAEAIGPGIDSMVQLYDMGIKFSVDKIRSDSLLGYKHEWITPEMLDS